MRGLFAMRCAARGLVHSCAVMYGMRCNALRAGWLHSRGAGGAMLLAMGGFKVDGWVEGWADGWV